MWIPCSSLQFLTHFAMQYKILQFLEGIQRSGEWNTKCCKENGSCLQILGRRLHSIYKDLLKNGRYPCKTLYSGWTRAAFRIWNRFEHGSVLWLDMLICLVLTLRQEKTHMAQKARQNWLGIRKVRRWIWLLGASFSFSWMQTVCGRKRRGF